MNKEETRALWEKGEEAWNVWALALLQRKGEGPHLTEPGEVAVGVEHDQAHPGVQELFDHRP